MKELSSIFKELSEQIGIIIGSYDEINENSMKTSDAAVNKFEEFMLQNTLNKLKAYQSHQNGIIFL